MLGTLDMFWGDVAGWPALGLTGLFGTTGVSLKPVGCVVGVFIGMAGLSMGLDAKGLFWQPSNKSNSV